MEHFKRLIDRGGKDYNGRYMQVGASKVFIKLYERFESLT